MGQDVRDAKSIFLEAVEQVPPDQWPDFLRKACGDDEALLTRVQRLLDAHLGSEGFMARPAAAFVESEPIAERPGETVGRYKLLEEIGEGGMGVVYMAEQLEPVRRKVAFKIIKPGMDTRAVIARFEAERQALALMEHPNIAHVFDAGATDSGRPYFVMELVYGIPLTEYCDQNQLTTRERLELFVQVCQAVEHAHQKGIIHRDLKPAHVMVTLYDSVPVPKIIDFGIAKAIKGQLTEKTLFTSHGQMIGTPLYMSPEQAELSGLDVDTRSDIYSLGVVLYELLSGSTPFDSKRVRESGYHEIRRMIREEEPPRPSSRISTLGARRKGDSPPVEKGTVPFSAATVAANRKTDPVKLSQVLRRDLDWIVMKALQKDRTRRYQTASDFARDIQRYLSDNPIEARPPTLADRAAKWARRHRPMVWSTAVLLVLSLIGSLLSTLLIAREQQRTAHAYQEKNEQLEATERAEELAKQQERLAKEQERLAKEQYKLAEAQKEEAIKQRDIAEQSLYLARLRLCQHDWEQGQIGRLHDSLDSLVPKPGERDLRSWEWYYYLSLCHRDVLTFRGHRPGVSRVAWRPDGRLLASSDTDGAVKIWDPTTGKEICSLESRRPYLDAIAWSPDGQRLAFETGNAGTVKIWDAATGRELRELSGHSDPVLWMAFSPDGRRLATASRDKTAKIWDAESARTLFTLADHPCSVERLAWSPDGKHLVSGHFDGALVLWDATTGKEVRTFANQHGRIHSVGWSPDGSRVAAGTFGRVLIWDTATWKQDRELPTRHRDAVSIAWSPDSAKLAIAYAESTVEIWDANKYAMVCTHRGHTAEVPCVAWSPDGSRLASASWDQTVKIWGASVDPDARTLSGHTAAVTSVAWSPKAPYLASASSDHSVKIWDGQTGKNLLTIQHPDAVFAVVWSPDGKWLASGVNDWTFAN